MRRVTGKKAKITIDGATYDFDEYEISCRTDPTFIEDFGSPYKVAVQGPYTMSFSGTVDEENFGEYLRAQGLLLRDPVVDEIDRRQEREHYRQRKEEILAKFTKGKS